MNDGIAGIMKMYSGLYSRIYRTYYTNKINVHSPSIINIVFHTELLYYNVNFIQITLIRDVP